MYVIDGWSSILSFQYYLASFTLCLSAISIWAYLLIPMQYIIDGTSIHWYEDQGSWMLKVTPLKSLGLHISVL